MTEPDSTSPAADRRSDPDGRDRIAAIERRYRRVAALLFAALGLQVLFVALGFAIVQDQRVDAMYALCLDSNREAKGLRSVVSGTRPEFRALVARTFPIRPDCRAYAQREAGTIVDLPW